MKKSNFVELSLSERSDLYRYSFLFSSLADLLTSTPRYVVDNHLLIDRGVKLLDDMLDGQEFILGNRTSFARDNLRLYSYYYDSYQQTRTAEYEATDNYADELKGFLKSVENTLMSMKQNPEKVDSEDDDIKEARLLFENLSNSVNSQL